MKPTKYLLRITAVLFWVVTCKAQTPASNETPPPTYTIFAPREGKESIALLSQILGAVRQATVNVASDFQSAIEAPSDVLLIWMDFDVPPFFFSPGTKRTLTAAQFEPFRKKKVIGIGYGAGMLFETLGLKAYERSGGKASQDMEIQIKPNSLCGQLEGQKVSTFAQEGEGCFGFYRPEEVTGIEEIARHTSIGPNGQPNTDYAAIVKEGNFILVGLAAPTSRWSKEYQDFFGKLADAFARAPLGPFTATAPEVASSPVTPTQSAGMGKTVQNEAGDWLKVVALEPAPGGRLKGGEKVYLTIQYNMSSVKSARIWAVGDGAANYAPSPELTQPQGEVDRFIVSEQPCENKKITVSMVDSTTRKNLVELELNVTHRWDTRQPGTEPVAVVGQPLPPVQFTSTNGEAIDLAQLKGKVVLLDFWATWCGPCKQEMPHLLEAYAAYKKDGFEILGISLDQDQSALERYCQEQKIFWPQYFDGKGWENAIAKQFHVQSIPHCILLDREGVVRQIGATGEELKAAIQELCKQPAK